MRYRDYLRWQGGCALLIGVALAVVAAPGVFVHNDHWPLALLFPPAVVLTLGGYAAARRRIPLTRPSQWLTNGPLNAAQSDRRPLAATPVKRRLAGETALWIVGFSVLILGVDHGSLLVLGCGLASVTFGWVQFVHAPRRVQRAEREQGAEFRVARRPGFGPPELARVPRIDRGSLRTPPTLPVVRADQVVTAPESSRSA